MTYLLMLIIAVILFTAFITIYRIDKYQIAGSIFFSLFILTAILTFGLFALNQKSILWMLPLFLLIGLLILMLLFGIYVLIALLFINARIVIKREGARLGNSLTLLLGIVLLVLVVFSIIVDMKALPFWAIYLFQGLRGLELFFFFHIFLFFVSDFLVNLSHPRKNQDFIIILGSGLIDGQVGNLLKSRIDRALKFYHKQAAGKKAPLLIMSGGQGADEPRSEAEAMAEYAFTQGIDADHVLLEEKSTNTEENMRFSKKIIDKIKDGQSSNAIFATSNYHLFRAGVYARKAGMAIDGLGSHTAFYYLPTALLREYAAFFWMHKKRLLILAALIFVISAFAFPALTPYWDQFTLPI